MRVFVVILFLSLLPDKVNACNTALIEKDSTNSKDLRSATSCIHDLPMEILKMAVSSLDDISIFLLSKASSYFHKTLSNKEFWNKLSSPNKKYPRNFTESLFPSGITPPKHLYSSLTDYIEKCCRYSFQGLGKVDGSSSLLVSADGSTIVMRKWENKPGENHPPTSTILTVNSGEEPVVLENCYANDVNADGTLVSGWWSLSNEKVLPESHFEWKEDKVNYNVTGRKLYKWSDQSSDESVSIYPGDNGYFFYNPCPYRWGKRPDIREPIADILKQQGVLPNDWILTSADSISANGVFLVGKGLYKGEVKGWLATIPRFHDDKFLPLALNQKSSSCFSRIYYKCLQLLYRHS